MPAKLNSSLLTDVVTYSGANSLLSLRGQRVCGLWLYI